MAKQLTRAEKRTKRRATRELVEKPVVAKPVVKPVVKKLTPERVLKEAKVLGLFKFNKKFSRYEILIPTHDYRKL